jgi:hypothetical protein
MTQHRALAVVKWGLGPIAVGALAVAVGRLRPGNAPPELATEGPRAEARQRALEQAPSDAVAEATWAFGSADSVKKMLRTELDRLPEGPARARTLIRFGLIDTNPDGQAAVFSRACADDPSVCDERLGPAAEREARARFVAPGNQLPLFLTGGHPPTPPVP